MADQISLSLSTLRNAGEKLGKFSVEMAELGKAINSTVVEVTNSGWQGNKKTEFERGWDEQKNAIMVKVPELLKEFSEVLKADAKAFEATDNS